MEPEPTNKSELAVLDGKPPMEPLDAATKTKPKPKPKKGPKYECPTLGRIVHVVTDEVLAPAFNCQQGVECAAIVSNAIPEAGMFFVHVFSPSTNPSRNRHALFVEHEDETWHWPEQD